jgi:transposase
VICVVARNGREALTRPGGCWLWRWKDALGWRRCGRQTLRDWVHRYNAEGLRGLSDRKPPGGIPKLKAEQEEEVAAWVRAGPDLAEDGRWRRKDLAARIERRFGVVLAERSVGASVWLSGTCRSGPSIRNRTRKPLRRIKKTSPLW